MLVKLNVKKKLFQIIGKISDENKKKEVIKQLLEIGFKEVINA